MTAHGPANRSIADRVRAGLLFTGGSDAVRQAAEFTTGIVLARLLMPADFGIVAVVGSILQLSFIVGNFGMGAAVIQSKDLDDCDRHTAFTLSVLVGLGLMAAIGASGPWSAKFFDMPLLRIVVPIMSLQLLLSGLSAIPMALLRRELAFKNVALIEAGSTACYALVGITLALNGYGVWSLVWAPLASHAWTTAIALSRTGYRPRLAWDRGSLDKLLGFGAGLTFKNLFVYVSRNVDNLIVAKMLGQSAAGLYTRSFNLTRMPQMRIVTLIYRVCFPAFCKLQGEPERLHRWYLTATAVVSVVSTPILLGLAVVADDFTVAVLGPQWAEMAPVVQILCVSALLNCFHMLGGALIEASGKIGYEVLTQSVYAVTVVVGCIAGAQFGIEGVAVGVLSASVLFYAMKATTVRAAVGLPVHKTLLAAAPSLAAGAVMYAVVYAVLHGNGPAWMPDLTGHWERLLVGTAIGVVTYPAALAILGRAHAKLLVEQVGAMTGFLRRSPLESEPRTIRA